MCNDREESKTIDEQYKEYIDSLKKKNKEDEPLTIVKRTPVEGSDYDKIEFNREMSFSELKKLCSNEGMVIHENLDSSQQPTEEPRNVYIGGTADTNRNNEANDGVMTLAEPNDLCSGKKEKGEPAPLPEIDSAKISEEMKNALGVNEDGIRDNIKKSGIHMTEDEIQATIKRARERLAPTIKRARERLADSKKSIFEKPFDPNEGVGGLSEELNEKVEADTSSSIANGYYQQICNKFAEFRANLNTKEFDELVNRIKHDLQTCEPGVDELPTLLYSGQPDMTAQIMVDGKPREEWPRITQQQVDALNAEVKKVNDSFKITPGMNFAKDYRKKDECKCGHVKGSCWCDEPEQPKPTKLGYLKTVVSDMPKSMVDKIISIPGEYWTVSSVDGDAGSVQIRYNADNVKRNISIDVYPQYSDQEENTEKKEKDTYKPVFFRIQYNQYGIAPLSYSFFCYNEKQMLDKGPNARRLYGWVTAMLVKFYQK